MKKVPGQAKNVDDIKKARMLYAQVKRSPNAHAKILSIDTSESEKQPGVKSVITGEYYKKRGGLYLEDKNFLAVGTAKFRGEADAAVAAETLEIAQQGVDL
ncbi:xanthine dehydrogenase family protein molybdopterin-binding subunit, partial [Anaerotruncus colihominis]|nr:xanthine dehydrogenase family protein molybdopterin-binding subunit [Anaerotruncus colihominis]